MKFITRFVLAAAACLASLHAADAPVADHQVIPLWPTGAPGSAARMTEPEKVAGNNISNIHQPTLTVYLPAAGNGTGCAIVVAPGGGHRNLSFKNEGTEVGRWFAEHGIAAFVLKYRLAKDDAVPAGGAQPYTVERDALADAQRALRLVRSHAAEWHLNPAAVGIVGFSAGGELAALAASQHDAGNPTATDPVERLGCRPDFQGLIYPGQSQKIAPTKDSPPAFLACGFNDRQDISEGLANVYLLFKKAGVPTDFHVYAGAGHGFGSREVGRSPAGEWFPQFRAFLVDRKFITP